MAAAKILPKATKFDAKKFIQIGSSLLKNNKLPENMGMNIISNTPVGLDLLFIGLARDQGEQISNLLTAMDTLENDLFSQDSIERIPDVFGKINRLGLAQESFKFRVNFVQSVQKTLDWDKLKVNMLEISQSLDSGFNADEGEINKKVKKKLSILITKEFKNLQIEAKKV